jgi:hypothetical protein
VVVDQKFKKIKKCHASLSTAAAAAEHHLVI